MGTLKNMDGNTPGRNFLDGDFPGGNSREGSLMGGNFRGENFLSGSFPDTIVTTISVFLKTRR